MLQQAHLNSVLASQFAFGEQHVNLTVTDNPDITNVASEDNIDATP